MTKNVLLFFAGLACGIISTFAYLETQKGSITVYPERMDGTTTVYEDDLERRVENVNAITTRDYMLVSSVFADEAKPFDERERVGI